jgi:lipoprotein-anchoring transpeptidase ErfK/SrfK
MSIALIRETRPFAFALLAAAGAAVLLCQVMAEPNAAPTPIRKTQKKASSLISKQEPPKVNPRLLEQATPENISVIISLGKQRVYFMVGEEIAVDSPISSGKRAGMTPKGSFTIVEKDADHRSSLYGNFVSSRTGNIVRAGVSTRIDSAPSGTVYKGAPMKWFMRFGDSTGHRAEGMHTGILPGYPASHGCVRLPDDIAKLFYGKVVVGTPLTITD